MTDTHGASTTASLVFLVAILLYMAPVLIAAARGSADVRRVARWDLRLGWTGVGWLAALTLALTSRRR